MSDYVETFDGELADSYRRVKDTFLDYYYKMDGVCFTKGNIFAPNKKDTSV